MGIFMHSRKIVSIGNINVDFIGKIEKLPKLDEKALLEKLNREPGGGGANFAVACSKLGLESTFVGCVGNDSFGQESLEDLKRNGVNTSHIKKVDTSTGVAFIFLTSENRRLLIEHRGANSYLVPSDMEEELLKKSGLLHASSVTPEIARSIGKRAKEYGLKTSLDLGAELTKIGKEKLLDILKNFDICFVNKETFIDIFERRANEKNISESLPKELRILVVTLGSEGAIVSTGNKTISSPSYEVETKDTTGAGDVFAAIFDKFILERAKLEKAVKYSMAGAAIQVQRIGGRKKLPTMEELDEFINTKSEKSD